MEAGVGVTISGQDSRDSLSEKITVNTDLSEMREQATQTCGKMRADGRNGKGNGPRAGMNLINPKNRRRPVSLE